ncbi:MAG TPA: class F sortase [Thermomicrobiales bacterium]|nr:class F sortase [Thermomicrobiales bacterium]
MGPFASRPRRIATFPGVFLALLLALSIAGPSSLASAQPSDEAYYVQETGHVLAGPFLSYWILNEGLTRLGMPVSESVAWESGERQYFEYGVLEYAPTSAEVKVAEAGLDLLELRHEPLELAAGKRVGAVREAGAFARVADGTGVLVGPNTTTTVVDDWTARLDATYAEEGGVERFGRPVSEPHLAYGKVVQWYESGRIDAWHSPDAEALVAPIGKELALLSGVDTSEVPAGDMVSMSAAALAGGDPGVAEPGASMAGFADAGGAFTPTRIVIPAIGVDAYIEQVGIYDGVMGTPSGPMNVGWYSGISSPGNGTSVVMSGHVDYYTVGPAVFYSLASLGVGSEIYVTGPDGTGFTYSVTGSTVVSAYEPAENVLGGAGGESLTLITCGGNFNGVAYDSRTIVYAVRV